MRPSHVLWVLLALASTAQAQTVPGNEAVQVLADGRVRIDTPPMPTSGSPRPLCRADAGCHAGAWHMVEMAQGLMECTEVQARPGSCRASTYGVTKRARLWVVKAGGIWQQCQYPDLKSGCVPVFARPPANLPVDAVQ